MPDYAYMRQLKAEVADAMLDLMDTQSVTTRQCELRDENGQRKGPGRQTIVNVIGRYYKTKGFDKKVLAGLKRVAEAFRHQKLKDAVEKYEEAKKRNWEQDRKIGAEPQSMI